MAEWFHMGGFAIYVWPSYGLMVVGVALNVVWARRSARAARVAARRRIAMRKESTT
jgi:heme exporter protein CcmD